MLQQSEIEEAFKEYLSTGLNRLSSNRMISALAKTGLLNESKALKLYFEKATSVIYYGQDGYWQERRCFVGPNLPGEAVVGDLWFDITELTPMILLGRTTSGLVEVHNWLSMNPVYVWQFRVFLSLVKWRLIRKYFMEGTDVMQLTRFEKQDAIKFVTGLYHEEAVAYAHWFGKNLCGQFDLQIARDYLKPSEFNQVLPSEQRLWDEAEVAQTEFFRVAIGKDTLDMDPEEEYEKYEEQHQLTASRTLYWEWEQNPSIGLETLVFRKLGLIKKLPRLAYEFIELENSAPRPADDF